MKDLDDCVEAIDSEAAASRQGGTGGYREAKGRLLGSALAAALYVWLPFSLTLHSRPHGGCCQLSAAKLLCLSAPVRIAGVPDSAWVRAGRCGKAAQPSLGGML